MTAVSAAVAQAQIPASASASAPAPAPTPAKPGRPRDAGADDRILRAVVDELSEHGVAGFRINNVASRAKVAKRTLYSRWAERDELILAGLNSLALDLVPPRTGSLVGDLDALYDDIAAALDSPRWLIAARCSFELPDYPELYAKFQRDCIDKPLAVVEDVLRDAQLRGELRADLDRSVAAENFTGSIAGFSSHIARLRGVSAYGVREQFLAMFLHGVRDEAGAGG